MIFRVFRGFRRWIILYRICLAHLTLLNFNSTLPGLKALPIRRPLWRYTRIPDR